MQMSERENLGERKDELRIHMLFRRGYGLGVPKTSSVERVRKKTGKNKGRNCGGGRQGYNRFAPTQACIPRRLAGPAGGEVTRVEGLL